MIGIVIVAHEPLASALHKVAAHVYSRTATAPCTHFAALDVAAEAELDAAVQQARRLCGAVDDSSGVLVLTDAKGSTPGNVADRLAEPGKVAVIAGVSLPMVLRALCYRAGTLPETVDRALAGGAQGIAQLGSLPTRQNQKQSLPGGPPGDDLARIPDQQ